MLEIFEKYAKHGGDRKSEEFQEGKNAHLIGRARSQVAKTVGFVVQENLSPTMA